MILQYGVIADHAWLHCRQCYLLQEKQKEVQQQWL
jgi:hypothetical protein